VKVVTAQAELRQGGHIYETKQIHILTDNQRDRFRHTDTDGQMQTDRCRQSVEDRYADRQMYADRYGQTDTGKQRLTDRCRQSDVDRQVLTDRCRQTDAERQMQTDKCRQTNADRQMQTVR
jgi:hypothetical protein